MLTFFALLLLISFFTSLIFGIKILINKFIYKIDYAKNKKITLVSFVVLLISFVGVGFNSSESKLTAQQVHRNSSSSKKSSTSSSSHKQESSASSTKKESSSSTTKHNSSTTSQSSSTSTISSSSSISSTAQPAVEPESSQSSQPTPPADPQPQPEVQAAQPASQVTGTIIGDAKSRIYHMPDQQHYNIKPGNAVYFNSEQDALNAGFRKSKR
ncbi:hypothetical protein [Convivina intestini]|uniref:DNA-entry nuclease n=1 Tax=Convivina intestini TaxID=1505726 RepID=A0A2U1DEI8_9LACO|nr:hypothetical protein [Convivina intestini]PVY86100.1 hypothetical protein C7384_10110 [Convivina intestini]CAH1851471.1 hypothetical protein R077811_00400 [Convivina intestini]CAH1853162.1 hypothetical protein R078131_00659 [Convivina intestini]SDB80809.1 hypothetical protein SAMN05216341_1012 [Leuconostocaceae bacterium R-53105]